MTSDWRVYIQTPFEEGSALTHSTAYRYPWGGETIEQFVARTNRERDAIGETNNPE